jgi:hypothetical protein
MFIKIGHIETLPTANLVPIDNTIVLEMDHVIYDTIPVLYYEESASKITGLTNWPQVLKGSKMDKR